MTRVYQKEASAYKITTIGSLIACSLFLTLPPSFFAITHTHTRTLIRMEKKSCCTHWTHIWLMNQFRWQIYQNQKCVYRLYWVFVSIPLFLFSIWLLDIGFEMLCKYTRFHFNFTLTFFFRLTSDSSWILLLMLFLLLSLIRFCHACRWVWSRTHVSNSKLDSKHLIAMH